MKDLNIVQVACLSPAGRVVRAVGAISGTSMDGIDVAVIDTDGDRLVVPGPGRTVPYPPALRQDLLRAAAAADRLDAAALRTLERAVTASHLQAVQAFMADHGLRPDAVAVIGLHGQTVLHAPQQRRTVQLGDGADVARATGVRVVDRFRSADVAAGGQGAPFAPLFHRAMLGGAEQPVMVLNLGGVGNVTFLHRDVVIAFDTGPASALLDDFMQHRRGEAFDRDGALAASGRADPARVAAFLADPFFALGPPKSLDRQHFHRHAAAVEALPDADAAATLAAFTVASAAAALDHVPTRPVRWLVTGGGRHNRHFMTELARRLAVPVEPVEQIGFDGDTVEAQVFAYLAVRSLSGLPLSLPTTTGVARPMPGGRLHEPDGVGVSDPL